MARQFHGKLQNLLQSWPFGTIATTKWLGKMGISRQLVSTYKEGGWIKTFELGAFTRPQETVEWYGGLYALQFQLGLDVHVGGKTALELQGLAHNIPMGHQTIDLLRAPRTLLPLWFVNHSWREHIRISENNVLPPKLEIDEIPMGSFNIKVSSRERAVIELLYLTPRFYNFEETRIIMESLGTLRADVLTKLLSKCTSEKVKRLILYFGEQMNHDWRWKLDQKKFKIKKTLLKIAAKNGKYHSKYNLFLPKEYIIEDDKDIKF